jgi:hypothetical protein
MSQPTIFHIQNSRLSRQREQEQASARPARMRFSIKVRGSGETRLVGNKGIVFTSYFLEKPTFNDGMVAATTYPEGSLPFGNAICLGYRMNDLGLYIGADMGFVVDSSNPHAVVFFDLTFEGTALRTTAAIDRQK